MKLDHVTYQVPYGVLFTNDGRPMDAYNEFFEDLLGMKEVVPDEGIEGKGWKVRWFEDGKGFKLHLVECQNNQVEPQEVDLALGHFCAIIDRGAYSRAIHSSWREDIGSLQGRTWLKGPTGIRVEVRPRPLRADKGFSVEHKGEPMPILMGPLPSEEALEKVFERCLAIFRERNKQHKDSWKREGWRGCLFNLRRKVERAWDHLWGLDRNELDSDTLQRDIDDLYDSINYSALAILAVEEGNRDGIGGWW